MATIYYDPEKDTLVPKSKNQVEGRRLNIIQRIVYEEGDPRFVFWGWILLIIILTLALIALLIVCAYGWLIGLADGWWLFWLILGMGGFFAYTLMMIWVTQPDFIISR